MASHLIVLCVCALLAARFLFLIYHNITSPLRSVGGPFLARWTGLWYFSSVWNGKFEYKNIELHRKHGSIVRISPDHYSFDDPAAAKTIYAIGTKFTKSQWYLGWRHPDPKMFNLFTDQNIKRHAENRKRFQAMYSMSSLVAYESYVDQCADIFTVRLSEFAKMKRSVDMGHWFQCYAFDVIGNITFGERFGFLDRGEDVDNIMGALQRQMAYSTLVGIFPNLHPWLFYPLSKVSWSGAGGRMYLIRYVESRIAQRKAERAAMESGQIEQKLDLEQGPQDFLEKLMRANEKDPEKITPYHQFMMAFSNIIAGSDTTAASLSGILYYLLKYPHTMHKLRQEIEQFRIDGRCGYPNITFKESQEMPYLQAVMKEALRLHSATGLPLWRVVPEGGAEISGKFFPAGTVVGINAWTAHFNKAVFGEDAEHFRPERWIETEQASLKEMEAYYMPFGLGSRTCIGRHISFLEMSKLIPRLITTFDFELCHPNSRWNTTNYWFIKATDFEVNIRIR